MTGANKARPHLASPAGREHPAPPQPRDLIVQKVDVRQAATNDDDVGIENVDDGGQTARRTRDIALQRVGGGVIAAGGARENLGHRAPGARASLVIGSQRRAGEIRLDAPALSAIALRLRCIARVRPGQWSVAPFAGDRVRTDERRTAHDEPAPVPVPRITPNTTAAPAAAPSAASDTAKQFASLAMRTSRARRTDRSSRSGRPISHTELAFLTRPVDGARAPGIPTPTVPRPPARFSSSTVSETMASSVAS